MGVALGHQLPDSELCSSTLYTGGFHFENIYTVMRGWVLGAAAPTVEILEHSGRSTQYM